MKKAICLLAWLCSLYTYAQKTNKIRALKIGDKVSASVMAYLNSNAKSASPVATLHNKGIIIDFWATYCAPCIESLPALHNLQKAYPKDIFIFAVNTQSKKAVDTIFSKRPSMKRLFDSLQLISIYGDTLLNNVFQHEINPHEVWINKSGVVMAITESRYVTASNIQKFIQNSSFSLPEKKEDFSYDAAKALMPQLYGSNNGFLQYYSAVLHYVPGLWGGVYRHVQDSTNKSVRITRCSYTLLELYGDALSNFSSGDPFKSPQFDFGKRVVLEIHDSTKFFYPGEQVMTYEDWENQYKFCYESVQPIAQTDSLYPLMVKDLNHYFGIMGRIEKRRMHCLALVANDPTSIRPDTGRYKSAAFYDQDSAFVMRNNPLNIFRNALSAANRDHIFIDETGYTGNINLYITSPLNRLDQVRNELHAKYRMDLIEMEKEIEVMVLSD